VTAFEPDAELLALFRKHLPDWFEREQRDLVWRRERDPYKIWISEVMLQQTRVDQAEPYFVRFLEAFPDVHALARANLDVVLLKWEGLGYYSRARNLHRAANVVMESHGGYLPRSRERLRALPGIGEYTSAAIASLAFGERAAAVDGNVIRVIARAFELEGDRKSGRLRATVREIVESLIPHDEPGRFNEAMMELGARVCTPRSPDCAECPLRPRCLAFHHGSQESFPQVINRKSVPHYDVAVGIIMHADRFADRFLVQKRAENAMLGGLWEFPGGKVEDGESAEEACIREVFEETGLVVAVQSELSPVSHAYSHFRVTLHPYVCTVTSGELHNDGLERQWIDVSEASELAFPRANRLILERLMTSQTSDHPRG
jgi:A/G-specific adenine glycosylase